MRASTHRRTRARSVSGTATRVTVARGSHSNAASDIASARRTTVVDLDEPLPINELTDAVEATSDGSDERLAGLQQLAAHPCSWDCVLATDVWAEISDLHRQRRDWDHAIAAWEQTIQLGYRSRPHPRAQIAELLVVAGRRDEAMPSTHSSFYAPGPLETADQHEWRLKTSAEILSLKICELAVGSGAILVAACRYLAERLLEAWINEGVVNDSAATRTAADDPTRVDVLVDAQRAIAERCLYAVDRNPMAVEMAKLSLWLVTLAKDRPFSFLDHAIVCGDTLLGITDIRQLINFHLDPARKGAALNAKQYVVDTAVIERAVAEAAELRRQIESSTVSSMQDADEKATPSRRSPTPYGGGHHRCRSVDRCLAHEQRQTQDLRRHQTRRTVARSATVERR